MFRAIATSIFARTNCRQAAAVIAFQAAWESM